MTMRDPTHPLWPEGGERTELPDVADRWKWAYVDWIDRQHRDRVFGRTPGKTLAKAVKEYLAHRENVVARQTFVSSRASLGHLQDDFGPDTPVGLVDPQTTLDRMLRSGDFLPSTVRVTSRHLSAFFGWCEVPYSVKLPREQARRATCWTEEQVAAIRAKAGDLLLPLDCGLYMGLRLREIWGLRWEDIGKDTVRVARQLGNRPLKSKRERTAVVLPGWRHKRGKGPVVTLRFEAYKRLGAVLTDLKIKAEGDRMLWHAARHTYARRFLEAAPDLRLLQASLGHRSVVTTEQLYDWLVSDKAAEMARGRIHGPQEPRSDHDVAPTQPKP